MSNVVLDLGGSIANLAAFIQSGNVSNTSFTTYASIHPATIPSGVIIDDVQNGVMVTSTYDASTNSVISSSSTTPTNMMISNFQVYPDSIDHNATMTGTLISNGIPLANTTVNVTATTGGTVPTSITTDANGNFSFTYATSQTSGTVNDTVDFHINGVLISTEPVDYAVGSIILVGTYPERVAYDTTNKDVYVTNQFAAGQSSGNGTVSVINGNTNKVIATVSIGNAPNGNAHAITCDSANGNVYVTNQFAAGQSSGNGTVSVINGSIG